MTSIDQLLGEFAEAWTAGRRPDVITYIDRASPEDQDELARRIDHWLELAPTPDYDRPTRALIASEPLMVAAMDAAAAQRAPLAERLPALRERAGLAVRDVAARLAASLGFSDEDRATSYLERLERDELDERRLSRRLLDGLATILAVDDLQPATAPSAQAFFRADDPVREWVAADIDLLSELAFAPAPAQELDELDRLFLGGPGA